MNVISSVLSFLTDRGRTCAELRDECSLLERQVNCLQDVLRGKHKRELEVLEENDRLAPLEGEREGLGRELVMERLRIEDLRRDFEVRYRQLGAVAELLRTRVQHLEGALQQCEEARKDVIGGSGKS